MKQQPPLPANYQQVETAMDAITRLRALNARFIHNHITNDVASHDALLHDRFICIASNGRIIDRASYLKAWATLFDPAVTIYWDTRAEHIGVFGDVALVRATNKHVEKHGSSEVTGMTSYTDIYFHENGEWKCIQAQLTSVAPEHWPNDGTIVSIYVNGRRQPA